VHVQTSGLWGDGLVLAGNGVGIQSSGCSPVILNSTFNNTIDVKVDRGSSASIVNCTLSRSRTQVEVSGYIDIGNWTHISVVDESLQPVPGCNVSIMDQMGRVSGSGVTGSDGILRNIAFREARLLWNRSEVQTAHRVLAFRDFNGSLQGSVSSPISAGELIFIPVSPVGMGWTEWTEQRYIFFNESYSNTTIISHAGAQLDYGAMLELEGVELLIFGTTKWSTSIEIKNAGLKMRNVRVTPLSASAPLQPSVVWVTYRAGSIGRIENTSFTGIAQVTTYSSNLNIMNSTFREFSGAGLSIQSCSPIISNSQFYMCEDGIWSTSGSLVVTDSEFLECTINGFYASGGNIQLSGIQSSGNVNGIMLVNKAGGNISGCTAHDNNFGIYLSQSSTSISDSGAFNNTESGFHLYESHSNIARVQSIGNNYGLNVYKSWPVIFNSSFNMNNNGIYSYQSAPYLENCQIDGNAIGIQTLMDANGILMSAFSSGKASEPAIFVNGGTRDHISLTLPSRAVLRSANMSIRGSEIGPDAVIEDAYTQFYPAIYENWIVWQDLRNEDWDIYAYDLSMDSDDNGVPNYLETPPMVNDPALFRITDDPFMQGDPDIFGDTIVWADYRNGSPDIYAYTFSNSTEWVVCGDYGAQLKPSIHGDRIVWQDLRNGNYDIFALNISTSEVSQLSDSNNHDMGPSVFGDFVVWYSYYGSPPSSDYSDIMLFDMKNWTLTNINDDVPLQYNPEIYENTIVWHDNRNVDWEIYTYDISTFQITQVTDTIDEHQNFMPFVYGDTVVYYTHNRFSGDWSVRMSNITTGPQTILQKDVDGDSHPVIYGNRIAWVNRTGNLNDVYVLDTSLAGVPENVRLDINKDGTTEFNHPGILDGQTYLNGTWLAGIFNKNLNRVGEGMTEIFISVAANGTGRVTLGPMKLTYDIPTYLVNCTLANSTVSGARCSDSSPTFINSTFMSNPLDLSVNSGARPVTLNSTFSDAKLHFQDKLSNLTVQNYLHVSVQNLTNDPLDARVVVKDNGITAHDAFTGSSGNLMWMPVTDRTHNLTGAHDNTTMITVSMNTNIFTSNPRYVDMSTSRWEIFSTDSVGPVASAMFPPPGWTTPLQRPEISVIVTDNLAVDFSSIRLHVQGFSVFYSYTPVPGGFNISYIHPLDYQNGTIVVCRIIARDFDGNVLDYTWDFKIDVRAVELSISLQDGWNLISIPFDLHDRTVEGALASISGKWDVAKYYDGLSKTWKSYRVGGTHNDLWSLGRRMGFWLHTIEACNLTVSGVEFESTSITLYAGWNLVAYPTMTEKTVAMALWGTSADRVEVHDPASPYLISAVGSNYVMKPGQGYWVRVPADTMWVVDW
jgi:beta propeller repeat protein/parallel beta-helix repeat protein